MGGPSKHRVKWNDKTQKFEELTFIRPVETTPVGRPVFINAIQKEIKDWNAECFWCKKIFLKKSARYYRNPFYPLKMFCSQNHKLDWISSISDF